MTSRKGKVSVTNFSLYSYPFTVSSISSPYIWTSRCHVSASASWEEIFIFTTHFLVTFIEKARENFDVFFVFLLTLHIDQSYQFAKQWMIETCCKRDKGLHLFKISVEITVFSIPKAISFYPHVLSLYKVLSWCFKSILRIFINFVNQVFIIFRNIIIQLVYCFETLPFWLYRLFLFCFFIWYISVFYFFHSFLHFFPAFSAA